MTVIRHSGGELALDALGRVSLILVPSSMHADEARYYAERYPQAAVLVPAPVLERCRAKLPRVPER